MNRVTIYIVAAVTGCAVLALMGCQLDAHARLNSPLETRQPVARAGESPAEPGDTAATAPSETANAEQPALFGDDPTAEQVPFETRLVTNLRQHSFSTEGLDFDPDLDPSGTTLVFASTRNSEQADLYLKKVEGSALTQLTGDPAADVQPCFSPDGTKVAFCSNRSGNWDIWMINRDGTGLVQLTRDRGDEIAPSWSPNGTQLAYTVWGYRTHQWEIWTLNVEQPATRSFLAHGMFPKWSPDGKRIAFQRARQRGSEWFSVWTIDLVDGEARRPTEVAQSDAAACVSPTWSKDGKMLAYCAVHPKGPTDTTGGRVPSGADVWVVDLATDLRMKLTDDTASAFNPVWGKGDRIFFVSARGGTENIWSLTTELAAYPPESAVSGPEVAAESSPSNETTKGSSKKPEKAALGK